MPDRAPRLFAEAAIRFLKEAGYLVQRAGHPNETTAIRVISLVPRGSTLIWIDRGTVPVAEVTPFLRRAQR
jgi:hypothetical protein